MALCDSLHPKRVTRISESQHFVSVQLHTRVGLRNNIAFFSLQRLCCAACTFVDLCEERSELISDLHCMFRGSPGSEHAAKFSAVHVSMMGLIIASMIHNF